MFGKRFKVIGTWGALLFIVTNLGSFLLISFFGPINGVIVAIPMAVLFAGFAGYRAALSLAVIPGAVVGNNQLPFVGASVALLAALLATGLNYILTNQVNYSAGLLTMAAAAIGGYIVQRKNKAKTKPFRQ